MSALQEKFDQTLSRADELLRERVRREELELERQDATDRVRARVKARENAEARRAMTTVSAASASRRPRQSMTKRPQPIAEGCSTGWRGSSRPVTNWRKFALTMSPRRQS